MMKKVIAGAMAAAMLIGSVPAMAHAQEQEQEQGIVMEFADCGVTLTLPEDFNDLNGTFVTEDNGEPFYGAGNSSFTCSYLAMPRDRADELMAKGENGEITDEESEDYLHRYFPVAAVMAADESLELSEEDVRSYFGDEEDDSSFCTQIASADGYSFFLFSNPVTEDTLPEGVEPEYIQEYEYVMNAFLQAVQNADFHAPASSDSPLLGYTFRNFETTDLDGNPITSEELFGAHEYTLLNFWHSGCGPCKAELGELNEINDRVADLDCAVVGILIDGDDDEAVAEVKDLFEENGIDYLNIRSNDEFSDELGIIAFPTSVFVDRNGTIVRNPIVGPLVNEYENVFHSLLGA